MMSLIGSWVLLLSWVAPSGTQGGTPEGTGAGAQGAKPAPPSVVAPAEAQPAPRAPTVNPKSAAAVAPAADAPANPKAAPPAPPVVVAPPAPKAVAPAPPTVAAPVNPKAAAPTIAAPVAPKSKAPVVATPAAPKTKAPVVVAPVNPKAGSPVVAAPPAGPKAAPPVVVAPVVAAPVNPKAASPELAAPVNYKAPVVGAPVAPVQPVAATAEPVTPAPTPAATPSERLSPEQLRRGPSLFETGKVGKMGVADSGVQIRQNRSRAMPQEQTVEHKVSEEKTFGSAHTGVINAAVLKREIRSRFALLKDCPVEVARSRRTSLGSINASRLTLRWTISPEGRVAETQVVATAPTDGHVMDCVKREMSQWSFSPPKGGAVRVERPFKFRSTTAPAETSGDQD